ncbi:hypothetical protein PAXRUDRAFT_281810 [Paxillus rubicundulus Ve08.2h10]|uniref:Uncharacterized protein n=1 Tax=Paxillus rubicundulus Ve08.2h10 TaxID=930991 RepID=A0A0D0CV77_9AGAM|nr:hypothetical protein PAXRUDRAFT_281810 [Paxillus rubicundulus Ve08.2h10]
MAGSLMQKPPGVLHPPDIQVSRDLGSHGMTSVGPLYRFLLLLVILRRMRTPATRILAQLLVLRWRVLLRSKRKGEFALSIPCQDKTRARRQRPDRLMIHTFTT